MNCFGVGGRVAVELRRLEAAYGATATRQAGGAHVVRVDQPDNDIAADFIFGCETLFGAAERRRHPE